MSTVSGSGSSEHGVALVSDGFYQCRCGAVHLTRPGLEAHLEENGAGLPHDPNDPTLSVDFNAANWTGTVLAGLISMRSECGVCGKEWHEGDCE